MGLDARFKHPVDWISFYAQKCVETAYEVTGISKPEIVEEMKRKVADGISEGTALAQAKTAKAKVASTKKPAKKITTKKVATQKKETSKKPAKKIAKGTVTTTKTKTKA